MLTQPPFPRTSDPEPFQGGQTPLAALRKQGLDTIALSDPCVESARLKAGHPPADKLKAARGVQPP